MSRKSVSTIAIAAALWLPQASAFAQDAAPEPADAAEGGESVGGVEDIIVTATRRSQNLQDVPIAVQAVTSQTLAASGITGTDAIAAITPGLNLTRTAGSATPFLRGVGNSAGAAGNEPSIATYVDGVYYPSSQSTLFSFNNVERIEVLRGPQGTLFGRNATGGLIHVITQTPSHDFKARIGLGFGNYDTVEVRGYVTDGLSDTLAADVALVYRNQMKGYGTNLLTGGDVQDGSELAIRSKWLFEPGNGTRATAIFDYSYSDDTIGIPGRPADGIRYSPAGVVHAGGYHDVSYATDPTHVNKSGGASLQIEQDIGFADLVTITSYRRGHRDLHRPFPGGYLNLHNNTIDRFFTQEIQLRSNDTSSPLSWIAGLYYFNGKSGYVDSRFTGLQFPTGVSIRNGIQRTDSYSAFGEATYEVAPGTKITAGLRYTIDKRRFEGNFSDGITIQYPTANVPPRATFKEPSWRLAIAQDITDDVMAYASYSRGFKSGVYNTGAINNPPVEPEILDAYEIGLKSTAFDRRLRLNLAGYYYDYSNIQLTQFNGVTQLLLNAAKSEIYGAEADFEAAVSDRLTLRGGISWVHGRYTSFPGAPAYTPRPAPGNGATLAIIDASGSHIISTPPVTFNLAADYEVPLGDGDLKLNVTYYYNDGWFVAPSNRTRQKSYDLVNAQIGWKADDGFGIRFWGRNLGNTKYAVQRGENASGDDLVAAAPRTYGVALDVEF